MPPRKSFKHQFSGLTQAAAGDVSEGPFPGTALLRGAKARPREQPWLRCLGPLQNILVLLSLSLCVTRDEFRLLGKLQSLVFFLLALKLAMQKMFRAAGRAGRLFGRVPDVIIVLFNNLNLSSDLV